MPAPGARPFETDVHYSDESVLRLVRAALACALRDCAHPAPQVHTPARQWLTTSQAREWADALGLSAHWPPDLAMVVAGVAEAKPKRRRKGMLRLPDAD